MATAEIQKRPWFGLAGLVTGCLAVVVAVLPLWVLPVLFPPDPIDKVVVDTATKIKDRLIAKVKGVEYKEPRKKIDWYQVLAAAAMILGVAALISATISFSVHESWRVAVTAGALGAGAILFQFSLLVAGAVLGILFVAVVLSFVLAYFGISL